MILFLSAHRPSALKNTSAQRKSLALTSVELSLSVEFIGLQETVFLCMENHEDEEEYSKPRKTHLSDGPHDVPLRSAFSTMFARTPSSALSTDRCQSIRSCLNFTSA